jgi:hypothetical protein
MIDGSHIVNGNQKRGDAVDKFKVIPWSAASFQYLDINRIAILK